MARNANLTLTKDSWTQITNADVTALRIQNRGPVPVMLMATSNTVAPTDDEGAVELSPQDIFAADVNIIDIWPGVSGAVRVWGKGDVLVSVSHA